MLPTKNTILSLIIFVTIEYERQKGNYYKVAIQNNLLMAVHMIYSFLLGKM